MHPEDAPEISPLAAVRRAPLWVFPAALLLFFLRFGYDYGVSDQDEVLPYLLHRLHPELLAQDWFVMTQAAGFGVRSYFVTVLQSLAVFVPVWLAVLLLYVACWLALAAAVYALGRLLTDHRGAAAAAVVGALVLTPQWTLGGNDLAHGMLVPSMAAWALGLWGLVLFLRRRMPWAGVLLGLATWMQALVGLHLAGLLGLVLLFRLARGGGAHVRPLLIFSASFLLSALPALGPLAYGQLTGAAPAEAAGTPSLFYVMAQFRNPHHYLFYAFPARSLVRFGLLAALGGIGLALLHRRGRLQHTDVLAPVFALIAVCCLVAFVFTEVRPSLFVAQLQLFKMTVLAKLLLVIALCGAVFAYLPDWIARGADRLLATRRLGLALTLAAWLAVLGGIALDVGFLRNRARPLAHAGTPVAQVEAWARTQAPRDAVFAVPPSWSGFRSRAERAVVVDFKAFPFRARDARAWFARLTALAPIALPDRGGPALQDSLDAAFFRQSAPALLGLAGRYGFDYVVRRRPLAPPHPAFEQVFASEEWIVYRLAPDNRPGA